MPGAVGICSRPFTGFSGFFRKWTALPGLLLSHSSRQAQQPGEFGIEAGITFDLAGNAAMTPRITCSAQSTTLLDDINRIR